MSIDVSPVKYSDSDSDTCNRSLFRFRMIQIDMTQIVWQTCLRKVLTRKVPITTEKQTAFRICIFFRYIFGKKIRLDVSCESSAKTIRMKFRAVFSLESAIILKEVHDLSSIFFSSGEV